MTTWFNVFPPNAHGHDLVEVYSVAEGYVVTCRTCSDENPAYVWREQWDAQTLRACPGKKPARSFKRCWKCYRELSPTMDAYWGKEPGMEDQCMDCRPKEAQRNG